MNNEDFHLFMNLIRESYKPVDVIDKDLCNDLCQQLNIDLDAKNYIDIDIHEEDIL